MIGARRGGLFAQPTLLVLLAPILAGGLLWLLHLRLTHGQSLPMNESPLYLLGALFAVGLLVFQGGLVLLAFRRWRRALASAEYHARERAATEARLSQLVSLAGDAVIFVDDAQRITLFNSGAQTIFGYGAQEVLGQPISLLLPESLQDERRPALQRLALGAMLSRRLGRIRHVIGLRKGGKEFPAEAAITQLEAEGQRMLTVVLRDVSEPRWEEEQQRFLLRAGELLSSTSLDYERTLARVADLAVQWLADWCLVYLKNGEQVYLTEVAHREPEKKLLAARMRGLSLDAHLPYLSRAVIDQRKPLLLPRMPSEELVDVAQSFEHLEILKDLAPYSYVGVPLIANERVLGALALICSESKRVFEPKHLMFAEQLGRLASLALDNARLYQQAREAARARDEVLGIVAHDLRTPLSTITLSTRWLQKQAAPTTTSSKAHASAEGPLRRLNKIASAAGTMERLIEDMLDVSRLEAGQGLSVRPSAQSATALLQEAVETALLLAREIHLVLEPTGALPFIQGDRDRLLQVFSNLVGNALKFTPTGGQVRLGARVEDGQVEFHVANTGPAITPEEREHLFERYWQANRHDRRGAGLGLSIVKDIVEAHGGHVRVESAPGQDTTFYFSVPIAPGEASAVAAPS